MNFTKDRAASLSSVALKRTNQQREEPELNDSVQHDQSDRTYLSTAGQGPSGRPRPGAGRKPGVKKQEASYRLGPGESTKFSPGPVEQLVQGVLVDRLKDQTYDASTCKKLSQELAAAIMEELKSLNIRRYKMVAVVSIGSLNERPGLQFGSRCLWDNATDSFASVKFTNGSLFAVAMIYGLYYD